MEALPPELISKILSFLDPVSLLACREVCVRWKILASKLINPLYLPFVMSRIMRNLQAGRLRDLAKLRPVCKLWKNGLDKLTLHQKIFLNGVTNLDSRSASTLSQQWNPFPSRIVRVKLCRGHDNPETSENPLENQQENLFFEQYGKDVMYLQVSLEHSKCAERHFVYLLNNAKNLKGLVISEAPSPFRFSKKEEQPSRSTTHSEIPEFLVFENLEFLKLDDSDSKLKYSSLYEKLIEKAPRLRHLEINGHYHTDMGIVRHLSNSLPKKLSLTKLKMDAEDPYTIPILEILDKSDLPLSYLSLKVSGFGNSSKCETCTQLLQSCLAKCRKTLQKLELKLNWYDKDCPDDASDPPEILCTFPSAASLSRLERLKLVGYRGELNFLLSLPSLKYLMIVNHNPNFQNVLKSEKSFYETIPTLRKLYLPSQQTFEYENYKFKRKVENFMYENDASFLPKYCGLYREGFP